MALSSALPALRGFGHARPGARRLLAFAVGSGTGLVADLAIFAVLNALGVPALAANLISTGVAITITYLLVTRHSFRTTATWRSYVAFFAWYATSALIVSTAIAVLGAGVPAANLGWKLAFVPVTFATNFAFSRWLFGERRPGAVTAAVRWANGGSPVRAARPEGRGIPAQIVAHPWISAAIATLLFYVFILPMNLRMNFGDGGDAFGVLRDHGTRLAFALCLWVLLRWTIRAVLGVLRGDAHYRRWLLASGASLVVLVPILVMIYPGHWVFDEYDTVYGASRFFPTAWQGYFTHVYYAFCMYLLPSKVAIVVVQMVFVAVVTGYVVTVLAARLRRPWLASVVLLAVLSPAVLLNDFYPLRLTAFAYLLLLVITHLLRRASEPRIARPAEFVTVAIVISVLCFWRSEGITALLLLPVAFIVLGMGGLRRIAPRRLIGASLAAVLALAFSGWLSTATIDPRYQFTAMINPMSTIIQDSQSPNLEQDLRAIDAVIDVKTVQAMPSYVETPALWSAWTKADAPAHAGAFTRAYLDLVVHDPALFLDNRVKAYLAANSQQPGWVPQVQANGINGSLPQWQEKQTAFAQSTLLGGMWNPTLKYQTARHLFLLDASLQLTVWTSIVWNATAPIAAVLAGFVLAIVRRRFVLATAAATVAGSAALVFLTEPAAYFMYWFPVYLIGLVAAAVGLARTVDHLADRRRRRTTPVAERPAAAPIDPPVDEPAHELAGAGAR